MCKVKCYYDSNFTICNVSCRGLGGEMLRIWLNTIRKNKNFTMSEVANGAEISESYYSMIENGTRGVPVPTAKKIAKVLKFDWTKFYDTDPED